MLRSIIVPLDGTPQAERALPWAEYVARLTGAALHLARVRPARASVAASTAYPHEGTGLPPVAAAPDDAGAHDYLQRVGREVDGHLETPVDWTLLEGEVTPCLVAYAREVDADGVILATRAPGALGRMVLGSTADELMRAVPVPVLAIPGSNGDPRRTAPPGGPILVAVDGSEASEAVLPTVARLAPLLDVRVTLLHVLPSGDSPGGMPFHLADDWEQTMRDGERYLDRIHDRLRRRRIRTDTIVMAHPSATRAICEVADEIDAGIVALGTPARSGLSRALLGSVTRSVASRGDRPVLVQSLEPC